MVHTFDNLRLEGASRSKFTAGTGACRPPSPRADRARERNAHHSANTYNIEAVDVFFSSGDSGMTLFGCFDPASTAMYCLPFTE